MSVTLQAVIEIQYGQLDSVPWAIAYPKPGTFMVLDDWTTELEVGLFVAQLIQYNNLSFQGSTDQILAHLIAYQGLDEGDEYLFLAPGGVQCVADTGVVITPGCCCSLSEWRRELIPLMLGSSLWKSMGHDPSPWVEATENGIRLWSDGGISRITSADFKYIDFEREDVELGFNQFENNLKAFLITVESWARTLGFEEAHLLAEKFDRAFSISQ